MFQNIASVDYIVLSVGYADRLLLSLKIEDTRKEGLNLIKLSSLKCKENHNAVRLDLINRDEGHKLYGEYSCVDDDSKHCCCCDYYREYPTESTWEPSEEEGDLVGPLPFEPYQVVAVTSYGSSAKEREIYYDDVKVLQDFLSSFPDAELGSSIIFKSMDDKPIPLVEYIQLAKRIDVLFCGCYSPMTPYSMELISNKEITGKKLLYLRYDTESG